MRALPAICLCLVTALVNPVPVAADEFFLHEFAAQQLTETYYSEGVAVGDINGDDVADIVYGPHWYAGPKFDQAQEIYPAVPQPTERYADNFFSWIYDFNNDGANDIFVVGFPGTPAYVYENPGKGVGQWTKHQVFDWVSNESPQLLNLVGDERPELICTRDGFFGFATIDWQNPFKTWKFHAISEKITATRFGHGLGIGDVNGDGLADIIHSKGWFEQPTESALNGRWKQHAAQFSDAYGGAEMYAYDVDGDGDQDIITSEAAHDFGLAWYEQTEPNQFKRHLIMGSHPSQNRYGLVFSELHSVALADMDGDGLQDIVTGKTYWSHHKQSPMWDAGAVVYWFRLERLEDGQVNWVPQLAFGDSGIGRQVTVADINQDGWLDIATGGMKGCHVILHQTKEVNETAFLAAQPKAYEGPELRVVETASRTRGGYSPIGPDGTVVDAIEGESLNARVSAGKAAAQDMKNFSGDRWSGDSQLWWTGAQPGDTLTLELDAFQDIESLQMVLTCARDYGFVEVFLDGKSLGEPIDLYDPEVVTTGVIEFDTPGLKAGKHELELRLVGANEKAVKSYMVGLDFLRFRPVDGTFPDAGDGIRPTDAEGRILNLDFESGDLTDWTATGEAFAGQPIKGDTVATRRPIQRSRHHGRYWIGGFEQLGDAPKGNLTSAAFEVSARFASFYLGGGESTATRIELFAVGEEKPFYSASGSNTEDLRRVVVDLRRVEGRQMFIRLVDEASGGWGHLNFDHFRLHAKRPGPLTPAKTPLVADEYPFRGLAAEAAAAAMKVPEGFVVDVCAAEPDVKQPIAMAIDDRGRTWIAEAYEYPQRAKGDKGRDRILVFEDTTGDGKFDSRKVFAEGLNLVSGLEVGFGGVWVGAAPYLMFIPDADGDDVADSEPQILLDGWGFQDTHETLNAFIWGPDGWLYGCHGVFTHSRVGKPGTPDEERIPINAGIWRYHPVRHEFEVFAHGTSNPWGVDFDDRGEAFCTACVIPHLYHIFQGGRYQRQAGQHFNEYTYDDIKTIADHLHYLGNTPHSGNGKSDEVGGGHAHAGAMIYQGDKWPQQYHGVLMMNNIHGQRLNAETLRHEDSGYVGSHLPDFLLTGDMASQILNMRYGPDGDVIMIDWYDMQACHRREVEVHDRSNGRIYRIRYTGEESAGFNGKDHTELLSELLEMDDRLLAELCLHPNDWFVRHSRRLLQERAAQRKIGQTAIARLENIATTHASTPKRLRAMWARHAIGTFEQSFWQQLLKDEDPAVRGWTIRLLMEQTASRPSPQLVSAMQSMAADDPSPVVRRFLASATPALLPDDQWDIVRELIGHPEDSDDHNLPLMYWYCLEPLADVDADRAMALGLSAGKHLPLLERFILRRVAGTGGQQALARLTRGLAKATDAEQQLTYLSAIQNSLLGQRQADKPKNWDAVYKALLRSRSEEVRTEATALGVTFGDSAALARFSESLLDSNLPEARRLTMLDTLLKAKEPQLEDRLVQYLASSKAPSEFRLSSIRGLAQFSGSAVGKVLVARYADLDLPEKQAAIATLCSRVEHGMLLLAAVDEGKIPASALTADLAQQLDLLGDERLSTQLRSTWGQLRKSPAEKLELAKEYRALVSRGDLPEPDLAFGRAIFAKTCQRCHALYGVGKSLGPDLTGSNRANLDYLLENIVDPSAVMAKEYQQTVFLTEDGQIVTGIVKEETDKAITIQTADALVVLPVEEISARKTNDQSMMPDNQLAPFSDHEVRSLIAYLRGKQQTPLKATEDNVGELFNGRDLSGWVGNQELWSVEDEEIVGKSNGLSKNEFLVSEMSADDFKLSLEIKLVENQGNSGIQFRSVALANGSVEGYQADVGAGWWGKLYEEHGRALLWEHSGEAHVKLGEWNRYEISAKGSKVQTWINGKLCVDLDDPEGRKRGIFAIQLHSGGPTEVRVRDMRLEILK